MRLIKISFVLVFCAFLASCSKNPDVIYTNGKFYTLDKNNTIVEAIAVREGKILATGKSNDLTDKYSSAKVVDLHGKTVVPGFIDGEGNLMEFSRNLNFVDLRGTKTLAEIIQKVTDKVKASKDGDWIGGFGWDDLALPPEEFRKIDHTTLDNISSDDYIYLVNARADIAWVNRKVLDVAKITKDTPNPEGGEIEKDDKGQPTGFLFDNAQELVMKILPQPTEQEVMSNVEKGIAELFKYGITEINDANMSEEVLSLYKKMVDENKFPIRLYAMISGKGPLFDKYIQNGPENYKDRIQVKCFELEYDGYFETQDAAMENDYFKDPKRKTPYNDEYDIKEMTRKAFENNFQVSVKANGDRAVNSTLNAIESIEKEVKPKAGRTRMEYIEFVTPADMQRIKHLEIIPSVRPEISLVNKVIVGDLIDPENAKNQGLWNTLWKQNGIIISGTDFPYHIINPLIQMYFLSTGMSLDTAINRVVNNSSQKLTVLDALKSFTVWSAYACFEENEKGTLETGKLADMVVLSDDILTSDSEALLTTKILMTIVRGDIVYENKTPSAYKN